MIRIMLSVFMIITSVCIVLLVMSQEGKSNGLSALAGEPVNDTTWYGKNKKQSIDAVKKRATACLTVLFFVLALLMNMT